MQSVIERLRIGLERMELRSGERACPVLSEVLQQQSEGRWECDFPVSVLHGKARIREEGVADALERLKLFDGEGHTPGEWSRELLAAYAAKAPDYLQRIGLVALTGEMERFVFANKRPQDFWKRLQNVGPIEAMVELALPGSDAVSDDAVARQLQESANGQWELESALRDAMRSKKENGALRQKPFVWIALVAKRAPEARGESGHVVALARHYFGGNVHTGRTGDGRYDFVIGFMPRLAAVSLRHFYKKG